MRLDAGTCERVPYQVYCTSKKMKTDMQNKTNNLKMKTGKPIYQIIQEALEFYESSLNDGR